MTSGIDTQIAGFASLERGETFKPLNAGGASGLRFDTILKSRRAAADPAQRARESAEEFVAQALVLPILKSIREQNHSAPPFEPGPYEQHIGALFDSEVASRLVQAQRFPIVDAVARNLLKKIDTAPPDEGAKEQGGSHGDAHNAAVG